ncbi:MAG: tetratricopeptide repeat protein [Gemmatimonadota bacterium]|nr:tetratricopeptide repeat protein [Gemmatimonadota bacterium]
MTGRMRTTSPVLALAPALVIATAACAGDVGQSTAGRLEGPLPPGVEAISFLGDTLRAPELSETVRQGHEARYAEAEDALTAAPEDVDALIWMGRRTAYLGHYREAIETYTHALELHPDDARLYRHRGHRYLTVREPDNAIADLRRAVELTDGRPDEVEPDGLPNAMNIPTSTLQFNIWYHLALAHYVQGQLAQALEAQRSCLEVSVHPDSVVATSYWLYMTLRRLGMDEEAAEVLDGISGDMEIIESTAYLDLLLLFKGERALEDLTGPAGSDATLQSTTTAYGLGVWHLLNGRPEAAHETWERILAGRSQWAAFGYIAAEGELARSVVG